MKVLLIGCNGSMGRRYAAIFKYLGVDFVGVDLGNQWPAEFDRALVATPTNTHFEICNKLIDMRKDFLCEKPVSKEPNECIILRERCEATGVKGSMVNNWCYALNDKIPLEPGKNILHYSYYNTGKDGTDWDCIQLHYLAIDKACIRLDSPWWEAAINEDYINHGRIERTYCYMIINWLHNKTLWTMEDAYKATLKVKEIYARSDSISD